MSFLSMSDEQVMAMGGIAPEAAPEPTPEPKPEPTAEELEAANAAAATDTTTDATDTADSGEAVDTGAADDEAGQEGKAATEGGEQEEGGSVTDPLDEDDKTRQPEQKKPEKPAEQQPAATELPADVNRIFESFRANGRDMKVKSVDEAIRLMQMGANYSQKNAQNKQKFGFLKVLEQNQLLDHEKLGFVVDLMNKKPEAIGKLIKDANFDVHEMDEDAIGKYAAKSYAPSEASLELDEVVDDLKSDSNFGALMKEIEGFDQASQALLGKHPEALRQLTEQKANGVYDKIMDEVNRRRVLGQATGPIMQAYNQIGQEMAAAGAFSEPAPKDPVKKLVTPGKKTSPTDKAAEERRRAAAPSKGASTKDTQPAKVDFLNMSDEDFAKHMKR